MVRLNRLSNLIFSQSQRFSFSFNELKIVSYKKENIPYISV